MKSLRGDISILFSLIIVDHGIDPILLWNEEKFKIREGESSTIFVQFNNFLMRQTDEREIFFHDGKYKILPSRYFL